MSHGTPIPPAPAPAWHSREGFDHAFRQARAELFERALALTGDTAAARALVRDTEDRAFCERTQLDGTRHFGAWCMNLLLGLHRRQLAGAPARPAAIPTARADAFEALKRRPVVTGTPDTTLAAVEDLFGEHEINHLPIVDPAGRPLGMVSATDLARITHWRAYFRSARHEAARRAVLASLLAGEVMRRPFVGLPVSATLREAAELVNERRIHCVGFVDDDGRLAGVITAHDLLRLAYGRGES